MTRRRARRRGSQCMNCHAPVRFFRSSITGRWRPFETKPVDHGQMTPRPTYPVENDAVWWPWRDLVEDLMVRRHCSQTDAEDEANAMPRYMPHQCPERPQTEEVTQP